MRQQSKGASKFEIQQQLTQILGDHLSKLRDLGQELSVEDSESPIENYVALTTKLTGLTGAIVDLLDKIPDEVYSNEYATMSDEQLLRILENG